MPPTRRTPEPVPFADRFVAVEGRRVGYVDEGPRDAAVPVVLLHGGGFDHAELTWRLTLTGLRGRFRMVVPDLPGYGESAGFGGAHDLPRLGRWLVAFLDAVGLGRVDVAGVSMGGGMALWLALEHPGRVRRLVPVGAYGLMGRVPLHPLAALALRSGLLRAVYGVAGHVRPVARLGLAMSYAEGARVTDRAVDELMAVARDQAGRRSFDGFLAAEMTAVRLRSDLRPRLGSLAAPMLLVHGTADRIVPVRHARAAARIVPGARLLEMPTGHWPMRERPEAFNAAFAAFLSGA